MGFDGGSDMNAPPISVFLLLPRLMRMKLGSKRSLLTV
jgi:hypothetical protein